MKHLVLLKNIINDMFLFMRKVQQNEFVQKMMKQSVDFSCVDESLELLDNRGWVKRRYYGRN